jgi:adiponectin receptor
MFSTNGDKKDSTMRHRNNKSDDPPVESSESSSDVRKSSVSQKSNGWNSIHFDLLPSWLRNNSYLHFGHRPQLSSFTQCFESIFRIHTETGNIWTHLIGFVAFIVITVVFFIKPFCDHCSDVHVADKVIFLFFFGGALLCLACSTLYHTVLCHSPDVSSLFHRLDHCGIAILIVGSVIPWLYYGFYCQFYAKLTYMIIISVLGLATLIVVMWEKFSQPEYRKMRAALFISLGLIAGLPIFHFAILNGFSQALELASIHYMVLMGALYIIGALIYASRIPERFFPGKCDIWFQSHQLFHLFVVAAAFVHYRGISLMAINRLTLGTNCTQTVDVPLPDLVF